MSQDRFAAALDTFLARAQAAVDATPRGCAHRLEPRPGRRHVLIADVHETGPEGVRLRHQRAFCFIDKATGDVLAAASWRKAAGRRGTIYADALQGVNGHGALHVPPGTSPFSFCGPTTLLPLR